LMKIHLETYGCTANRGDSELILGQLLSAHHTLVSSPEEADVVIVNTCAVKGTTYRRMKSRLERLRREGKRVVVAGCLPLIDPGLTDGFDAISCKSIPCLPEILSRIERGERAVKMLFHPFSEKPLLPRVRLSRVSAIVQIAEGCLSNCSYCSVKLARGTLHSFSPEALEREVREAVEQGAREILLTGQDTAAYGLDLGTGLPELLSRLASIPGEFRMRVGMMNPLFAERILPGLLEAYESPKIYKFLHLPVQSGDDGVLRDMRRGYTVETFRRVVRAFRQRFPDLQLVTDIIVGFPTESGEAFRRTLELVEEIRPDKVNLSKFSPLPGTDASRFKQLSSEEVAERSRILTGLCHRIGLEVNRRYVGKTFPALIVERGTRGGVLARTPNYKPVVLKEGAIGEEVCVTIVRAESTYLVGERV